MRGARKVEVTRPPEEMRASRERLESFGRLHELLEGRREAWTREHPDQWVAIGHEGVERSAGTLDELLNLVDTQRVRDGDLILEYLAVNPPRLML